MEKANASSASDATVTRGAGADEAARAVGTYDCECIGPAEAFREQYIKVRDAIARKVAAPRWAVWQRFGLRRLELALAAIPLERKWAESFPNTVTTVGKNLALDTYLAGSAYTVTGPYVGLISSVSWSATNAADTMSSHAGWTEAGNANAPTYTAPRKTAAWSAASGGSKALSSALSFAITGTGTVKGAFMVYGSGAVSTIDNTSGVLYSAGVFSGGDKTVGNGDTLSVSYTASL
jgi:Tfp pilus assembly protein PilV